LASGGSPEFQEHQMKTLFTTAVVAGTLLAAAGSAHAASSWQCQQYARQQAEAYAPTGQGLVAGGLLGALGGAGIAGISGGKAGTGAIVGGVGGALVGGAANQNKQQQIYNNAYYSCMNGGGYAQPAPALQPVAGPPPVGQARVFQNVNVRNGPGTQYQVIGVLPSGSVVGVNSCTASWCSINVAGGAGWAYRNLLSF
jgi:uncharacterized protein YgiM (DUF1202 family)